MTCRIFCDAKFKDPVKKEPLDCWGKVCLLDKKTHHFLHRQSSLKYKGIQILFSQKSCLKLQCLMSKIEVFCSLQLKAQKCLCQKSSKKSKKLYFKAKVWLHKNLQQRNKATHEFWAEKKNQSF